MDWKVVVAAPLVIENQLPVKGTYLIWETPRVSCSRDCMPANFGWHFHDARCPLHLHAFTSTIVSNQGCPADNKRGELPIHCSWTGSMLHLFSRFMLGQKLPRSAATLHCCC